MSTKSHESIFHIFHYAREKNEVNCGFNLARTCANNHIIK
jgi:hypothetical protein